MHHCLHRPTLLTGIEIVILPDGALPLPDLARTQRRPGDLYCCSYSLAMVRITLPRLDTYFRNFPKTYVEREKGLKRHPDYKRYNYRYTEHRPWSMEEKLENSVNRKIGPHNRLVHVPLPEFHVYRGDMVQILIGRDKGKRGEVVQTVKERNWCFVGGKNLKYETYGKFEGMPGKVVAKEMPLDVATEVALIDPVDNSATEIEWRYTEQGERVRVSKRTGRIIPKPMVAQETYEFKSRATYRDEPKDTLKKEVTEVTFKPSLLTFEQDIMQQMGIVENGKQPQTFWY
ncbi:hypothetical protein RvY_08187 [Ramazzottius varieornatus]|uniref:Large ribosomal subunit protein uL24 C-terminal domain-containing protein n=1 Tax=Ramazzottius varieornatus TaxID=947166 RepID=A0A1D1V4Y0_RAMVA|nr:hypothetical protein RvY_08187 [Ramazzottius varieornatus]